MAEIFFDINARCDEVVSARKELARLREELLKTTPYTSKEVVKSLENAYQAQREKVKDLTYEIQRYNLAMKMFGEKILSSKDLVQGFIGKAEETKTKICEVSSEVDKMQSKLSSGNLDVEAGNSLSRAISGKIARLEELGKLYNDLIALAQKANAELQDTISQGESSVQIKGVFSDIVNAKGINDEVAAHTKVVEQVNAEATALKNVSQSLQDVQPFKSYEDQINVVKQKISDLQQKIVDTKESIQFAKNDVANLTAQKEANAKRYRIQPEA